MNALLRTGVQGSARPQQNATGRTAVAAARGIRRDHGLGENATPDAVSELFGDLEITKEAHIVREFVNTREVSALPVRWLKRWWASSSLTVTTTQACSTGQAPLSRVSTMTVWLSLRTLFVNSKRFVQPQRAEADATAAAAADETAKVNATLDALEA